MIIETYPTVNSNFATIIKSGNYENVILNIMNLSTKSFPGQYKRLDHNEQSNGECDFVDIVTGEKFDAKLPFIKNQGKLIGSNHPDIDEWFNTMHEMRCEFYKLGEFAEKDRVKFKYYNNICRLIRAAKPDENMIFLFPYKIDEDAEGSILQQFMVDYLYSLAKQLKADDIIGNRKIYAIYPSMGEKLVIRCLNTNAREFVDNIELRDYIDYLTRIVAE